MTDEPSAAERAAVDELLGAQAGWFAGETARTEADRHVAFGGYHMSQQHRHLLLPALHALQSEIGWISKGGLNYVCRRLGVPPAEAFSVASFYALFTTNPRSPRVAHICDDIACKAAGAEAVIAQIGDDLGGPGAEDGQATWLRSPCLGMCEQAPAAFFQLTGDEDAAAGSVDATTLMSVLAGGEISAADPAIAAPQTANGDGGLRILRRIGAVDPDSLDSYRAAGGYAALARAVAVGGPQVVDEVKTSRIRGRGGAAFPMGIKWEAVAAAPEEQRYVICNADESEPGTFKDRVLMEHDPFAVVEAMTIAGYATGSDYGYLYIRGEYPLAAKRLEMAITQTRDAGLLGGDVMGAGFKFDMEIRRGAGAYICGEETALFNSIEGQRGEPRQKPPFPTQAGLFGKPTVVNNVETLVNVLDIVTHGGEAFAAIGTSDSTGPKLFCVCGTVARPGVYEVEFGATLRDLLELAGGVPPELRAVLLGGAAGAFVGPDQLDLPLTFEGTREAGTALGSGVIMAFDSSVDMDEIAVRITAFFRDESCGQCVPCRVGTVRQEEALHRMAAASNGQAATEIALIDEIAQVMQDASICGLGHTASGAIQSAITLGLIGGDG